MVKLNKIYTKTGDKGETGLVDGSRVAKHSPRPCAIGAVDETNSALGICRIHASELDDGRLDGMLARIQNDLFDLGADLSTPHTDAGEDKALRITAGQVARLESEIDAMNADLDPLDSFVLPGGHPAAAHIHQARALCRRAEREMVLLASREAVNDEAMRFINRLSDHLFVMARLVNKGRGGDVLWEPGLNRKNPSDSTSS